MARNKPRPTPKPRKAPPLVTKPQGPVTMWSLYKRRFWTTQFFIAVLLAITYWGMKSSGLQVLLFFVAMQLGAFIGAAIAVVIQKKSERGTGELPLGRR